MRRTDRNSIAVGTALGLIAAGTTIRIFEEGDATKFADFQATATANVATDTKSISVTGGLSGGILTNGANVGFSFSIRGTQGAQGAQGSQGTQGTQGVQGAQGAQGAAALNTDAWRVLGLVGINNAGAATTQYDLSAQAVVLYNPSDGTVVVKTNTGVITNDVTTAGSAANGRDQAGAFTATSWIHFYLIWNGTTLATLSSATAPPTGPTLPSGYTHWAYCGAVRFVSSALRLTQFMGSKAWIDLEDSSIRPLSGGTSTTFAAVDCSGFIPPNSRWGLLDLILFAASGLSSGTSYLLVLRVTGSAQAGQTVLGLIARGASEIVYCLGFYPVNASQSLDYKVSGSAIGAYIQVIGYVMPNGDS